MAIEIVWFFSLCTMFFFGFQLHRNESVYRFRTWMVTKVGVAATADVVARLPWKWRYDVLTGVSYDQMLWQFWRPLTPEEWYEDISFLSV